MENLDKKEILNTFIKAEFVSQIANAYYSDYKRKISEHLEGLGFKHKKVNSRVRTSRRFEIYITFHISKNKYDLDNLLKRFLDILRHYLGDDDINIWKISALKTSQPPIGIKVRVIEYWSKIFL